MGNTGKTFYEFEHDRWQQAADAYDQFWKYLVLQTIPPLLNAADVNDATSLLDVACGPGYVAGMAADRGARVTGIDFSSVMTEKARQYFPDIRFETGDAAALPYADESFSAVTINFGLLHFVEPEKCLSEAYRVLEHGGKLALTVWAVPEQSKGLGIIYSAVEEHGTLDVELPPGPPFFRFSNGDESMHILLQTGFSKPGQELLPLVWEFNNPEDFITAFYEGTARTGPLLRSQDTGNIEAIHKQIITSVSAFRRHGKLHIPMAAMLFHAIKL